MNTLRDALWLAGRDIKSSWMSFPATVVISFLFGLLGTAQYSNLFGGEMGVFGEFFLDFYLVCVVPILGTNIVFNRDYYSGLRISAFDERLSFLKSLPVGARFIVAGRVFSSLASLACAAPPFFLAPYLASGGLRAEVGGADYVWFAGAWLGYSLAVTGAFAFSSFGFRWNPNPKPSLFIGSIAAYVALAVAANLALEDGLTLRLMQLAKNYGPITAAVGVASGCVAMTLFARASEKRLQRRDIG
ncbi:MAG: hypothetical protein H0U65_08670 [Rubrobacter sp.]|nr:hypothetical protein [Rubrobacter sp.]